MAHNYLIVHFVNFCYYLKYRIPPFSQLINYGTGNKCKGYSGKKQMIFMN